MSMKRKAGMDNSVEITNYFSGGDREREEMLAQPEKCKCPDCSISDCGTGSCAITLSASVWVALDNSTEAGTSSGGS